MSDGPLGDCPLGGQHKIDTLVEYGERVLWCWCCGRTWPIDPDKRWD